LVLTEAWRVGITSRGADFSPPAGIGRRGIQGHALQQETHDDVRHIDCSKSRDCLLR
jgi:hypothetical protein